jgi:hypothetical protein
MEHPMTKSSKITTEYLKILEIQDPIEALDECRSAFKRAKRGYWRRTRTLLGITATIHRRVSRSTKSWGTFMKKDFWKKCSGDCPTMADQSDGLRFVVRYVENALSREAAQNAYRHTVVIQRLLDNGVKPGHMLSYLSKSNQGIGATYRAASAQALAMPPIPSNRQSSQAKIGATKPASKTGCGTHRITLEAPVELIRKANDMPVGKVKIIVKHLKDPSGAHRFVATDIRPINMPSTMLLLPSRPSSTLGRRPFPCLDRIR